MAVKRPVVLVLRGLALGDLLTAVPALRGLRRAYPGHRLVLAAPAALAGLLPSIGAVDELLDVSGPGPLPADRPEVTCPDVAVNLHGRGPQSIAALSGTRPGRLLTHAHLEFPCLEGPPWRQSMHEVHRWCELLGWYGIPADPADLALDPAVLKPSPSLLDLAAPGLATSGAAGLTGGPAAGRGREGAGDAGENRDVVVVHPGAGARARRWPPERFAEVAATLEQAGHRVVVTGNAAERPLASRVGVLAGLPPEQVLAGRTDLRSLARLVAGARLVVCGDTGVAHLATAFATPSVVLFGPVAPAQWGPPPTGRHVALWSGGHGDPYGDRPDPGLMEIGVVSVLDAAASLLEVGVG
ncbi:glycosyl transferase [Sphaerisporangium melleum]|uniref:Glycosyl transferase n=1 Tax=Sphaerisporangium melleum TaxID=321316 RepID=A0A917RFC2_9ACTN|nr:glycosyltransferase family 9 protein [Sphaerisporangium melleum]GGL03701.1 glycosyl transferase [Sphaerisporangium melleum]GII74028.1 glycosyl transferase [Sphaerisporangium melleum]